MGRLKVASLSTQEDAMNTDRRHALRQLRRAAFFAGIAAVALANPAQAFLFGGDVARPASHEFGFGPRESANGKYIAYLRPVEPLGLRKPQAVRVLILDAQGRPVEGARISVDGGMPEHGHGLPAQSDAASLGGGMYDVEGLRFSMGGWWALELTVDSDQGADRLTFNLSL
jgi:hypothetical protein